MFLTRTLPMNTHHLCTLFALAALFAAKVAAHSWIEQLQVIGSNGSYVGDYGYPRGYMARTDPGFDGMSDMWLLPPSDGEAQIRINGTENACHPSQRTQNYTSQYPKLKVARGDWVAMKYLENGHVTQPWVQAGKPYGAGTIFLYGTTQPYEDTLMVDVLKWNANGTGGNQKGWLMAAQQYDDERCHQISASPISIFRQQATPDRVPGQPNSTVEQWCETDLRIPDDVAGSSLTVYWVWQWSTAVGTTGAPYGKDEYYTTCLDLDIIDGGAVNKLIADAPSSNTIQQQDPQTVAVANYKSRTAETTSPHWTTWNPSSLPQLKQAALETDATETYYSIPPATVVTDSTTYVLQAQGTALNVNGQLAAYVDCSGAVTTGSVRPTCPVSSIAVPTLPTTTMPTTAVSTGTVTDLTSNPISSTSATTAGLSACQTTTVTETAMVTVTVTAQLTTDYSAAISTSPTTSPTSSFSSDITFPIISVPQYMAGTWSSPSASPADNLTAATGGTGQGHVKRNARHPRDFR